MSVLFSDDFVRANGAPGNGWTVETGTWDIYSDQLRCHVAQSRCYRSVPSGADYNLEFAFTTGAGEQFGTGYQLNQYIRADATRANCYYAIWSQGALGQAYVTLGRFVGGVRTDLAIYYGFTFSSGTHVLALRAAGNVITALLDGVYVGSISDTAVVSGGYVHLYGLQADKFFASLVTISDVDTRRMLVSPDVVLPSASGVTLTLIGNGTTWTPGTPGSPTFTASAGTITAQTVQTAGVATLTYTAPAYPAQVTLADPASGLSAFVTISETAVPLLPNGNDPFGVLAFLIDLREAISILIDPVAAALYDALTIDPEESVLGYLRSLGTPEEGETFASELLAVLTQLTDAATSTTARYKLEAAASDASAANVLLGLLTADGSLDLPAVIAAIVGSAETPPDLVSLRSQLIDLATTLGTLAGTPVTSTGDLLTAIGGVDTDVGLAKASADSAVEKLDTLTGTDTYSLAGTDAAVGVVGALATAGLILGIIGLVRGTAATAVQTVALVEQVVDDGVNWAAIAGHVLGFLSDYAVPSPTALSTDVSGVLTAVNGVHDDLGDDLTTITDAISGAETDLASKLDAMDAKLDSILEAVGMEAFNGSRWPGADKVTLGTPVAISESMYIQQTMEGVIYEVTSVSPGARTVDIGGKPSYGSLGIMSFESDNGYMERFQTISFKKSLIVPLSMVSAAACVLEWRPGTTGTVTPWARTVV